MAARQKRSRTVGAWTPVLRLRILFPIKPSSSRRQNYAFRIAEKAVYYDRTGFC